MKTYRIAQTKPFSYEVQMGTVSGWITVETLSSKAAAIDRIRQKIEEDNFTPKYFDVAGTELTADQPVEPPANGEFQSS